MEYFSKKLSNPQDDLEGLVSQATPLGQTITLDPDNTSKTSHITTERAIVIPLPSDECFYLILPRGDFDAEFPHISHIIQLIRLGSESREQPCEGQPEDQPKTIEDNNFVYIFTPPGEVRSSISADIFL